MVIPMIFEWIVSFFVQNNVKPVNNSVENSEITHICNICK